MIKKVHTKNIETQARKKFQNKRTILYNVTRQILFNRNIYKTVLKKVNE